MEHNQLKIRLLKLVESVGQDSQRLRDLLKEKEGIDLSRRAVEMALLRYWRQGLLKRERKGRRFKYILTERGTARRNWLESRSSGA